MKRRELNDEQCGAIFDYLTTDNRRLSPELPRSPDAEPSVPRSNKRLTIELFPRAEAEIDRIRKLLGITTADLARVAELEASNERLQLNVERLTADNARLRELLQRWVAEFPYADVMLHDSELKRDSEEELAP